MADKNIQMTQRNTSNTDWDNLFPITKAANVKTAGGSDVEAVLTDYAKVNSYYADTGAANAYVITPNPAITTYATGQRFTFKATNANTGASTLNVNVLGVKPIVKGVSTALVAGDIPANKIIEVVYDGTNLQLLSVRDASTVLTTAGDMLYASSAYTLARLAKGSAYQVLGMNSGATAPQWQASLQSLMTAAGDILYASGANTPARLSKGTDGQALVLSSGIPSWQDKLAVASGSWSDTSTNVVAGGIYTKTIPIGFVGATGKAFITMQGWDGIAFFNTTKSLTKFMMLQTYVNGTGYFKSSALKAPDGVNPINNIIENGGYDSVSVLSCYISGSNLIIEFKNTRSNTCSLNFNIDWEVIG